MASKAGQTRKEPPSLTPPEPEGQEGWMKATATAEEPDPTTEEANPLGSSPTPPSSTTTSSENFSARPDDETEPDAEPESEPPLSREERKRRAKHALRGYTSWMRWTRLGALTEDELEELADACVDTLPDWMWGAWMVLLGVTADIVSRRAEKARKPAHEPTVVDAQL